jgi:LacI family transcriptional regulator
MLMHVQIDCKNWQGWRLTTLKKIAAELCLSPATVSRALNGFPEVNVGTRARVAEAALRLKYRPNQVAQKLVTGRSGMIGMVLRSAADAAMDPSFFQVMTGLSQRLADHDVDLVFHAVPGGDEVAPYRRLVAKNLLDGFILNAPKLNDPRIAFLREEGIPLVVHGRSEDAPDYAYYDIDNLGLAFDSARLLLDLGHRRIALLNGQPGFAYAEARRRGFLLAMGERMLRVPERFIQQDQPTEDYGYRAALACLSDPEPPTAFVASNTFVAAGILAAVADKGLTVGDDVSIIGHDDAVPRPRGLDTLPALTVTRSPLVQACTPLADKIHALLAGTPSAELQTIARTELIIRATTGPIHGALPWT